MTGVEWDEGGAYPGLWMCTSLGLCTTVKKIDVESGRVLISFYPVCDPRGLAIRDRTLWTVSAGNRRLSSKLMRFDISEDDWRQVKRSRTLGPVVPVELLSGLTTRADTLWTLDRAERTVFPIAEKVSPD